MACCAATTLLLGATTWGFIDTAAAVPVLMTTGLAGGWLAYRDSGSVRMAALAAACPSACLWLRARRTDEPTLLRTFWRHVALAAGGVFLVLVANVGAYAAALHGG